MKNSKITALVSSDKDDDKPVNGKKLITTDIAVYMYVGCGTTDIEATFNVVVQ